MDESKGRFRLAVLELDGLPADDAEQVVRLWDESLDRVRADGLNGGVQLLRERLENWAEVLQSPEMGRQPASPQTAGQLACIASFTVLGIIILAGCCFWWLCCCGYAVLLFVAFWIGVCLALPIP